GSDDGAVCLWEVATGKRVFALGVHTLHVSAVEFAPDGQTLASVGWNGVIRLWSVATGKLVGTVPVGEGRDGFTNCGFAAGGKQLAAVDNDGVVQLWDVASEKEVHHFQVPAPWHRHPIFSPDGRWVASTSEREHVVTVWEVATGKKRLQLP